MKIVVRIGGSVLVPEDIDREILKVIVREVLQMREANEFFIVVGGGRTARKYINAAREYDISENSLDRLGIFSSQLNALLLATCLKDAEVVKFEEVSSVKGIPIMGGTVPGQTTDTVAALLAESVGADVLVKVTDVDGIYTADPKMDKTAKKIQHMSFDELEKFSQKKFEAGISSVIDPVAAGIICRNRLKVAVIGKNDMEDLEKVIKGDHSGTVIE